MPQNFLQSTWWREYAKSNNIWIIWTDDTNQNILAILVKFLNLQKKIYENNKSPGNDTLKAVFYKHFSNELAPVLLDVYDSWGEIGTINVTSRTGIITATYKKVDKRDIENYRPISLFNLYYKIHATILKGYLCYKVAFYHKVAIDV